ncbi:MAG: magnesium transporter [Tissierellia bacterium]|jgi:magnesium transporter|nr:magnesium transporter [Tissierellia bacterium]
MEQKGIHERIKYEEQDILRMLESRKYAELREFLKETNEIDIAEIISGIEDKHYALILFRMLSEESASQVFAYLDIDAQVEIVTNFSESELREIMEELFFDDIVDLVEEMPAEYVNKVLRNISREERQLINEFLGYPEDSAGSVMTIEYVSLYKSYTVQDALNHIQSVGLKKETVYSSYVVDTNRRLNGIISLRKLVTSDPDLYISDIMEEDVIYVHTDDDQEYVADLFAKYGFLAMPVVDKMERLVGIVTYDDVLRIIEEETTEDFQRMAAVTPNDDIYLDTDARTLAKSRLPWIMILMISATITAFIINLNLDLLGKFAVLSILMPMLTDTGGNASSQSSTLIIRGIATGEIEDDDLGKILKKELQVSTILVIILVFVVLLRVLIISNEGLNVALTIALTLTFTIYSSNLIGGTLPIAAKKLGLDPAVMAVPMITTIVDAMSLIIYFNIARIILL